jgi:hypothetical protein
MGLTRRPRNTLAVFGWLEAADLDEALAWRCKAAVACRARSRCVRFTDAEGRKLLTVHGLPCVASRDAGLTGIRNDFIIRR